MVIVHEHDRDGFQHPLGGIGGKASADELPSGNALVEVEIIGFGCSVLTSVIIIQLNTDPEQAGSGIPLGGAHTPAGNRE